MENRHGDKDKRVRVDEIAPEDTLFGGARWFFNGPSIEELARLQGVKPITDISLLAGGFPEDEDVEEFVAEIYRNRSR